MEGLNATVPAAFVANRWKRIRLPCRYIMSQPWTKLTKDFWRTAEHTASKMYRCDTAFYILPINRHRRIWIYLPLIMPNRENISRQCTCKDGQNLFDKATVFPRRWGVDDSSIHWWTKANPAALWWELIMAGKQEWMNTARMILPGGIHSKQNFSAEGDAYLLLLLPNIKPFISIKLPAKENNTIGGSFILGWTQSVLCGSKYVLVKQGVFSLILDLFLHPTVLLMLFATKDSMANFSFMRAIWKAVVWRKMYTIAKT